MEERYEQIEFNAETDSEVTESAFITENAEATEVKTEGAVNAEEIYESSDKNGDAAEEKTAVAEESDEETDTVSNESNENTGAVAEENTEGVEKKADVAEGITEGSEENTEKSSEESNDGAKKKSSRRRAARDSGEQSDGSEAAIAPEKMPKTEAMRVLEAIMFANGDEVYYDQFAKIIGYTTKEAIKIVDAYAKMYDSGSMPRGIRFVKYDKCCQLTTAPDLGEYVTQMIGIRGEPQLSAAAMETLAIVAYNQPVTRAYIEQVRRVDSTRPIAVLLDRELIEEKGRLEVIGRPRLFGTTQNFLKTFGITSLDALPSLDLFAVEG